MLTFLHQVSFMEHSRLPLDLSLSNSVLWMVLLHKNNPVLRPFTNSLGYNVEISFLKKLSRWFHEHQCDFLSPLWSKIPQPLYVIHRWLHCDVQLFKDLNTAWGSEIHQRDMARDLQNHRLKSTLGTFMSGNDHQCWNQK